MEKPGKCLQIKPGTCTFASLQFFGFCWFACFGELQSLLPVLHIKTCLPLPKLTQLLHIGAFIQRQVTWISFCRIPHCSLGIQ